MKPLSIEPQFIADVAGDELKAHHRRLKNAADTAKLLRTLPFNTAYDLMRLALRTRIEKNDIEAAIDLATAIDAIIVPEDADPTELAPVDRDLHAMLLQLVTTLQVEADRADDALVTAARLLTLLAAEPKRKDEPFLQTLGALLYDIAYVHNSRGQYKQAERELEKSMKVFERLAKNAPERYASAHILAQNASTQVYRSRVKQVNMLAHNQVATSTYLDMMNEGIEGAADRLIESLASEGRTLAQMGRYREAVQYFSRALKYLTKIEPEMTDRQLELSVDLGEALLNVKVSREKGVHLLNTMLHKATKLGNDAQHRRIVDILLNAKSRRLDILGIWHKVFPK